MLFPIRRDTRRVVDPRQFLTALLLGDLDALLHIANGVEVLGEFGPVALWERPFQLHNLLAHGIKNALPAMQPDQPRLWVGASAITKQTLENDAWVILRRQGRVSALPGNRVGVGTRKTGVASARCLAGFNGQLERGQLG